ncbi:MAG: hypothetical protein JNG90_18475, partial [Planctomycetaceae bacterium]|nr:hypothetical protein [Planctomycetaceae bacterium]
MNHHRLQGLGRVALSLALALAGMLGGNGAGAAAAEWKAGTARAKITPEKPLWMSGYASRDRPAEGTLHDLWAKVLVLDDGHEEKLILVT